MLDPRSLAERRDEILESCRRRRVDADVDGAIALYKEVAARQTELNETNRRRNEHQASGKRKMEPAEREAHTAEGRALKESVARVEAALAKTRTAFEEALAKLPNFVHPEVPEGGEDDFREIRRVGAPTQFDFEPLDHLAIAKQLDLIDFEGGAKVAGQKWYYLKNEAVLLELALQRYALDFLLEEGFTPFLTPDVARPEILDGIGFNPRGEETQHLLDRQREPLPGGNGRDHTGRALRGPDPRRGRASAQARRHLPLLPHRGGGGGAREQGTLPGAPVQQGGDVRLHPPRRLRDHARVPARPGSRRSSRGSSCPTG